MNRMPVDDEIAYALSRLVGDAQTERRDPSHSDISFEVEKAGLTDFDPKKQGSAPVGKAKRIRGLLISALEVKPDAVEKFAYSFLASIKACGGFRENSQNYSGKENIESLRVTVTRHGLQLDLDGNIIPTVLDNLSESQLTEALNNYVLRAKKGVEDGALLVGTSKDLIEAVAAHVITTLYGSYSPISNFPTLLANAFIALDLSTSQEQPIKGEQPGKALERNLFDLACSINRLRNKQGTGHGRPFMPQLTEEEVTLAIESIGVITEFLLKKLEKKKNK